MKKHILFLIFGMFISFVGNAQTDTLSKTVSKDTSKVNNIVNQMPEFPGGQNSFMEFLKKNLKYPEKEINKKIEGRVYVSFIVEKDGSLTNFKVLSSIGKSFSKETLRVLKSMPKWIAGKQNGIPVRVKYTVPIVFLMEK